MNDNIDKYLYIQENKDWNYDNKFKYGFTSNPANRIISEQHSYKSSYIALYKCIETSKYLYEYKEYDKIISSLNSKTDKDIIQESIEYNIDLSKFIEIKDYLIDDGGGTEFIKSNEGIELLDYIFTNIYKDIGINVIKLSKYEINTINNEIKKLQLSSSQPLSQSLKSNKIILRDYQLEIIKKGINTLIETSKFYLELATGAGKSTIVYYILNNIILKNIDVNYTIIILTPRINISSQNINKKYINIIKKKINIYNKTQIKNIKTFNNSSTNIISCCIQSFQYLYEKIIMTFDIKNIIIWFDEAHYALEGWVKFDNTFKTFFLIDNERIIYRIFTSASPDKEVINNNINVFGNIYSPISVRNLIKDKWLAPIKPHIMDFDNIDIGDYGDDDNDDDIDEEENIKKYYYYTNTILNTFQKWDKRIGLNFHNSCRNAIFAFYSHYNKFINSKTHIKPYLLISNKNLNLKVINKLDDSYKYLLNFNDFDNEDNNSIAYIVNMYNMGYDNSKIDFLVFGDPKLSNKDIIQSIGRGIRTDGLGFEGRNAIKENNIIIPIYNKEDEKEDRYIKFNKMKEIFQYLIYDVGLDVKDIQFHKKSYSINECFSSYNGSYYDDELDESKIIANIIKWDIEPTSEKWTIKKIINHLMNNKINNYNSYLEYISLNENKELNLPLDLFKTYPNFNFNDTYKLSPYYSRDECIEAIKNYKNDFIDDDEIDKENNNNILEFLHNKDAKIPNFSLWYYYGGLIKDFILFI